MASEVKVPTLGESVTEATIGEWLKQPGDAVALDEPVASLETDKVAVEVPAPIAGVMGEHKFAVGDTVEVGTVITAIEEGTATAGPEETRPREEAPVEAQEASADEDAGVQPASASSSDETADVTTMSPAVRRAVLEHGLDPTKIRGTGKDGRLTKEDVLAAAKAKSAAPAPSASAPAPSPTPAPSGARPQGERREERVRMTRIRQTIAKRLKGAQEEAALLTTFNDCDMTAVIEAREAYKELFARKHGIKLGFMSFFAKAACLALKDVPAVNAQIDGDEIVYHDYVDISVAVSAPTGLVVPVVRNADTMSFAEIELAIAEYGKKAKDGTLSMADMQGGTFTISNGGVYGSLMSTPILNAPQSGILGMHKIQERPVVVEGQVVVRPMMYLALSYDHRIVDGKEAVTFLVRVKESLEAPERLVLDL